MRVVIAGIREPQNSTEFTIIHSVEYTDEQNTRAW